jgi:hypothetical protein
MIDDSATGREIIQALDDSTDPPLPYLINEMDISRWKATGYLRHVARQERLASVQINREDANEMVTAGDTATIPEATLQIIASQYYEFLGDFNPEALKAKLAEDPLKYTRFLNVFSRVAREIMNIRKYRDTLAQANAAELKQRDPDRDLVDNELLMLVNKMDHTFKVARPNLDALLTQARLRSHRGAGEASVKNNSQMEERPARSARPELARDRQHAVTEFSSCRLINTPIHRGADDVEPTRTVSTGSEPTHTAGCSRRGNETLKSEHPNDVHPSLQTTDTAGSATTASGAVSAFDAHEPSTKTESIPGQGEAAIQNSDLELLSSLVIRPSALPQPQEFCPRCHAPLPPRASNGERPNSHCQEYGCGAPVRDPRAPFEPCPHCGVTLPDLLPNGQRPAGFCPECKTPLPPPPPTQNAGP